jgi:hypothetical protein
MSPAARSYLTQLLDIMTINTDVRQVSHPSAADDTAVDPDLLTRTIFESRDGSTS